MNDIMKKQTEKIQNKIQITENTSTLEQLRERIQQDDNNDNTEEKGMSSAYMREMQEQINGRIKIIEEEGQDLIKNNSERPKEIETTESSQSLSNIRRSENCIQVITPALNPTNGTCINFPTPCDVPSGWKKVESCTQANPIEKIDELTCSELCLSWGYEKGICRKWAVVPSAQMGCQRYELDSGPTSDCFVSAGLIGTSKTCCCVRSPLLPITPTEQPNAYSEFKIIQPEQGERQTEEPTSYSGNIIVPNEQGIAPDEKPQMLNESPVQSDQQNIAPIEIEPTTESSTMQNKEGSTKSNR